MRFQPKVTILLSLLSIAALAGCEGAATGGKTAGDQVDIFAKKVLPILEAKCMGTSCHSAGGAGASALVVSSSSSQTYQSFLNLVVPGSAGDSPFRTSMGMDFLTDAESDIIQVWIDEGANRFGKDDGTVPPPVQPSYAGLDVCANYCHLRQSELWLASPHGNYESYNPSTFSKVDNGLENTGFPTNEMLSDPDCVFRCHDPLGDGRENLTPGYTGDRPRAVVGCESCHGAGSDHFPAPDTAILYPAPSFERCGQCHNDDTSDFGHDTYHPEAKNIKSDYQTSFHNMSKNEHVMVTTLGELGETVVSATDVRAKCSRCHTDEGARLYKWVDGTYDAVVENIPDTDDPVAKASAVECRTCHAVHDEGNLFIAETRVNGTITASAEYNTCTFCHAMSDAYHGAKNAYAWSKTRTAGGKDYYTYEGAQIIYDTHSSDLTGTATKIEGYVVKPSSERACRDCHNIHSVSTSIDRDWAESAHAGRILRYKEDAAEVEVEVDEGVNPSAAPQTPPVIAAGTAELPFTEADWDSSGRQSCQRCHTATGFSNFIQNTVGYVAANNDFSHLSGWSKVNGTYTVSGQNELIFCWACHADNAGGLRTTLNDDTPSDAGTNNVAVGNRGKIALQYGTDFTTGTASSFTPGTYFFPSAGKSNVCLGCHGARGSGFTDVKTANDGNGYWNSSSSSTTSTTSAKNYRAFVGKANASFDAPSTGNGLLTAANAFEPSLAVVSYVNNSKYAAGQTVPTNPTAQSIHYLVSGASIFSDTSFVGFEYKGRSYTNDNAAHTFADTEEGPCLTCHFNAKSHRLELVAKDEEGRIVDVAVLGSVCSVSSCHGTGDIEQLIVPSVEAKRAGFAEALSVLEDKLADKGAIWTTVVSASKNKSTGVVTTSGSESFWRDVNGDKVITTGAGDLAPALWTDSSATCADDDFNKTVRGAIESGSATAYVAPCAPVNFAEWGNMGNLGAGHNFRYFTLADPAAYMHNPNYAKRLMFDSIDWLDDGVLDGVIDLTGKPAAAGWISPGYEDITAVPRLNPAP